MYKYKGVYSQEFLSGNHKTKSAVHFRLLKQNIEAHKKINTAVKVTNR